MAKGYFKRDGFKSKCVSDCSGHEAGYRYAKNGGSTPPHINARSFRNGMDIANGTFVQAPKSSLFNKTNLAVGVGITAAINQINKKPTP